MERLTTFAALALILTATASAHAESDRYTVAGDVPNPHVREYAAGESVTPRQLVRDAGAVGIGSAVIVRGSQPHHFTEYLYADSAGEDSFLQPGDVVVFHDAEGNRPEVGNVVIAYGTPGVVMLSAAGNQLGSLLNRLKIEFGAATTHRVVRTASGGPKNLTLAPHDALAHGDVLILDRSVPVDGDYLESLFAAPGSAVASPNEDVLPEAESISAIAPLQSSTGLMIPDGQYSHAPTEPPALDIPLSLAAMETVVPATGDAAPPIPTTVAVSPSPEQMSVTATNVSPIWNGVFIVGLFGSLMLVITGWMKTQRERAAARITEAESAYQLRSPEEVPAIEQPIVSSWADDIELEEVPVAAEIAPLTDMLSAPMESVAKPDLSIVNNFPPEEAPQEQPLSGRPLVQETEWFGDQWRAPAEPTEPRVNEVESDAVQRTEHIPMIDSLPERTMPDLIASAAFEAREQTPSVVEAADDLEDLIQNRLPIQLCQADLPLRVTLFGRPAGPRRLRIDNAHKELAAPHFFAGSRAQSRSLEKVETAESNSGDHGQDQPSFDRALSSLHGQGH